MPLTNAQKQRRARDKRARTMARWEGALNRIANADGTDDALSLASIADEALNPETNDG